MKDDRRSNALRHMMAWRKLCLFSFLEMLRAITLCRGINNGIKEHHRIGHRTNSSVLPLLLVTLDHPRAGSHVTTGRSS